MRVFFHTSLLAAAVIESHPMHGRALPWLQRARARESDWVVASHSLAEMYAVLTTLPVKPRISPGTAWRLIRDNVEGSAVIIALSALDDRALVKKIVDQGLAGGSIHDALPDLEQAKR